MADYNLTGSFTLNKNPWDIIPVGSSPALFNEKNNISIKWNKFQTWLYSIGRSYNPVPPSNLALKTGDIVVGNPILNTQNIGRPITNWLIELYNSSTNLDRYKINDVDIKGIQEFTAKSNPSGTIRIDEWVGSQTSRMKYPDIFFSYKAKYEGSVKDKIDRRPYNPTGYIGAIWGDKRIAIPADKLNEAIEKANNYKPPYKIGSIPSFATFLVYDSPATFPYFLQEDALPGNWYNLNQDVIVKSENAADEKTKQQQEQSTTIKNQTGLITTITPK